MSRGRRAVRVKPVEVDGYKFASASEAMRYEGLKALAGKALTVTASTDGRMLVCEWHGNTQVFTLAQGKPNKYNARKTVVQGITFDSGREALRYVALARLEAAGEISQLKHHPPPFELVVNGVKIGRYTPDFIYYKAGKLVVEDSKSEATRQARDYPLRKKLMVACFGIQVAES
jgi:hypothetical protein